ncbi:MAG: peptidyl-prolyl cis-trans isomerase [bacterium]
MKKLMPFILLLVIACNNSPSGLHSPKGKVVAEVDRDQLTIPQVDYAAEQLRVQVSPANLPKILDRMSSISVLAAEAVRQGYLKDEKIISRLAWAERMFLANELASRIAESIEPTPEEIAAYFQQHRNDFTLGLKLMLILLPDSITAEQTLAELKQGADFTRLARERSLDTSLINIPGYPTRGVGISLGWNLSDEERIFALNPGEVSPILATPVGFQIVKVQDKRVINENPGFNEITQYYIAEALKSERRRTTIDSLINTLRGKAKITLKPEVYSRH